MSARADPALEALVEAGLRHAERARASVFAIGLDRLGDLDLPPPAALAVNRDQMRALGALYLAADLEPAGIISAVELLSSLRAAGAAGLDLGPVAAPLHGFWQARNQRPDPAERASFYARLFGVSYGPIPADGLVNTGFEGQMLDLCEALYRLEEARGRGGRGGPSAESVRVRAAARHLLQNLSRAGRGTTPFLAAELMATLKAALAILKHPHLQGLYGARDIWGVIAGIRRRAGQPVLADPHVFVDRGRAGMTLIVWLADAAQRLQRYGQPIVAPGDPVIPAAVEWLQATLAISERQARPSAALPGTGPGAGSGRGGPSWADIGA